MKRTYITPNTEIDVAQPQQWLAGSGVTGLMNDKLDIGYGGVDENGEKDPSANQFNGWDDGDWDKL